MTLWTQAEIDSLSNKLQKPTKDIWEDFCDQYGSYRTYDSVQKKIKKLRDAFSDLDETVDEETITEGVSDFLGITPAWEGLFTPHVTTEEKTKSKAEAKAWLQELVDAASQLDLSGPSNATAVDGNDSTLVICLSDTHFGKQTKVFSLGKAYDRLLSMPDLIVAKGGLPPVDEVVEEIMCLIDKKGISSHQTRNSGDQFEEITLDSLSTGGSDQPEIEFDLRANIKN